MQELESLMSGYNWWQGQETSDGIKTDNNRSH